MLHRGQSHLKTITRARPVSLKPPIQHLLCIGTLKGAWGACTRRLNGLFFWRLNNSNLDPIIYLTPRTNFPCHSVLPPKKLISLQNFDEQKSAQQTSPWCLDIVYSLSGPHVEFPCARQHMAWINGVSPWKYLDYWFYCEDGSWIQWALSCPKICKPPTTKKKIHKKTMSSKSQQGH